MEGSFVSLTPPTTTPSWNSNRVCRPNSPAVKCRLEHGNRCQVTGPDTERSQQGGRGSVKPPGGLGVQRMNLSAESDPSWLESGRGHSEAISGGQEHNADRQGMRGRGTERQLWDGPKTGGVLCRMGETDQWWVDGSGSQLVVCGANRVCKEVWGASRGRR